MTVASRSVDSARTASVDLEVDVSGRPTLGQPPPAPPRGRRAWRIGVAVSFAGAVVMVLALLPAMIELGDAIRAFRRVGGLPLAMATALASLASMVGFIGVIAVMSRRRPRAALLVAMVALVIVRVVVIVVLDGPLRSDWLGYHVRALGWLQGAPPLADRPMGYPILLGEAYRLGGLQPWVPEVLNLAIAIAGGALLALWVGLISGARAAAVALALLAMAPSLSLYTPLVGTEVTYATMLVGIVILLTLTLRSLREARPPQSLAYAAAAGALLGVSAYVRTTSLALVPVMAVLPLLGGPWRRALPAAIALLLALSLALAPALAWNRAMFARWTPTTSLFTGWSLYVGMNLEAGGRWNPEDVERRRQLTGLESGRVTNEYSRGIFDPATLRKLAAWDELAFQLGLQRINEGGLAILALLPIKWANGWASAADSADWVIGRPSGQRPLARAVAGMAAQVWWVVVLALATTWLLLRWRRRPTAALLVASIVVPMGLSFLVLEAQPRYHEYSVPIVAGVAAMLLAHGPLVSHGRRAWHTLLGARMGGRHAQGDR